MVEVVVTAQELMDNSCEEHANEYVLEKLQKAGIPIRTSDFLVAESGTLILRKGMSKLLYTWVPEE